MICCGKHYSFHFLQVQATESKIITESCKTTTLHNWTWAQVIRLLRLSTFCHHIHILSLHLFKNHCLYSDLLISQPSTPVFCLDHQERLRVTADDVREKEVWQIWVGKDVVWKVRILDFILSEDKKPLEAVIISLPLLVMENCEEQECWHWSRELWEVSKGAVALTIGKIWWWKWQEEYWCLDLGTISIWARKRIE